MTPSPTTTADYGAIVLHLRATRPANIRMHMGRAVQYACLQAMNAHNPQMVEQLHDAEGMKPYAASGLMQDDAPFSGIVDEGTPTWVRFVGLRADVIEALLAFANNPTPYVEIDKAPWQVERVEVERNRWVGAGTYLDLLGQHQRAKPKRKFDLLFATPTAFHSKGNNMPLPIPDLIFGSLAQRFAASSGLILPDDLADFVTWFVRVSRYEGQTRIVHLKQGSKQVGFVGQVQLSIATSNAKMKHGYAEDEARLRADHDNLSRMVAMLCDWAGFAGVGIKTSVGMGMVRWVK